MTSRGKSNKDVKRGIANRRNGIFKKANHLHKFYSGVEVAIVIIQQDGHLSGYQSHPGLIQRVSSLKFHANEVSGPDEFDTVADRRSGSPSEESENDSQRDLSSFNSPGSQDIKTPLGVYSDSHNILSSGHATPGPYMSPTIRETLALSTDEWTAETTDISSPSVTGTILDGEKNLDSEVPIPNTTLMTPVTYPDLPARGVVLPVQRQNSYRETLMSLAEQLKW